MYPTFSPALATSMVGELDHYFDFVLWNGTGSIGELFTSGQSFIDSALATNVYKVQVTGTGFQSVMLGPERHGGILTRAGFLAAHADTDSSGPVPRGVFVLNTLLCTPPSPPPANVPPAPPASGGVQAHQTTRQRFDAHLNEPFCKGCHTAIDGVGFGFEEFDGIGVYRTTENGQMVDTSGTLTNTDVDGNFNGAAELAAKLVTSREVMDCFVRQAYRYAMGQEEEPTSQKTLDAMGTNFAADSHMTDVFMALIADPAFVTRTTTKTGP
jgi:hypothetical protein